MAVYDPPSVKTPPPGQPTPDMIPVTNPITGETIGSIPVMKADEVRAAVERARAAQPAWAALGVKARARLIQQWNQALWEDQKAFIDLIRREMGKTEGAAFVEVAVVDIIATFYARKAPRLLRPNGRKPAFPLEHYAKVIYKPYGVVGFITPWNYPLLNGIGDIIAALIAGNTAVIKPSEITPFTAIRAVELMHKMGIPRDVVQIVTGAGSTGAALVDLVDYVSFTGSTATGRKIAVRCAERLIPCSLELGGKDPAIVLPDANLDDAAKGVLAGALENTGQVCVSTERVYVDQSIYEPFMAKLLDTVKGMKYGGGDGLGVHFGSLTNERELLRAEDHIADAVAKGAQVVYGGKRRPDLGPLFFEPTILTNVDHTMRVMTEETFGPLVPVMKVRDVDEAVRLANDSEYGLSAAVFSSSPVKAEAVAKRIVAGDVAVNHPMLTFGTPGAPMGGAPGRASGLGRRNGIEGLMRFVSPQAITVDRGWVVGAQLSHSPPRAVLLAKIMHELRKFLPV
ncbi:MAG: succinic semialdehyde dehydrogenase [Anaerolineae bacterium]